MKKRKVCVVCGSENITIDANAVWDPYKDEWVLKDVFDNLWCEDCEGPTKEQDVPDPTLTEKES